MRTVLLSAFVGLFTACGNDQPISAFLTQKRNYSPAPTTTKRANTLDSVAAPSQSSRFFCIDDTVGDSISSFQESSNGNRLLGIRLFWTDPLDNNATLLNLTSPLPLRSRTGTSLIAFTGTTLETTPSLGELFHKNLYLGKLSWDKNVQEVKTLVPSLKEPGALNRNYERLGFSKPILYAVDEQTESILLPLEDSTSKFQILAGNFFEDNGTKEIASFDCGATECANPVFDLRQKKALFSTFEESSGHLRLILKDFDGNTQDLTPAKKEVDQFAPAFLSAGNFVWLESDETEVDLVTVSTRTKLFDLASFKIQGSPVVSEDPARSSLNILVTLKAKNSTADEWSLKLFRIDLKNLGITSVEIAPPKSRTNSKGEIESFVPQSFVFGNGELYGSFSFSIRTKLYHFNEQSKVWSQVNSVGCNQPRWIMEQM